MSHPAHCAQVELAIFEQGAGSRQTILGEVLGPHAGPAVTLDHRFLGLYDIMDFPTQLHLLEELESRQDAILQQLDQLNERIESALKDWVAPRGETSKAA